MSNSIKPVPNTNTSYDPLPLESEQHSLNEFHDYSPQLGHIDLPPEGMASNAARPRFLGAMQGDSSVRQSVASSQNIFPSGASDYSSVYGLNPGYAYNTVSTNGSTPQLGSYRDDPAQSSFDISGDTSRLLRSQTSSARRMRALARSTSGSLSTVSATSTTLQPRTGSQL